jgi:predicted nuclease with RNAse H fold
VITLGIDLASQDANTASCLVEWADGRATVRLPCCPQTDEELIVAILDADATGIDIPFGWPDAFVSAVTRYRQGQGWPDLAPSDLCYRETDRHLEAVLRAQGIKRRPLSVASDRIAIPAMRAAGLLTKLAERGVPVDRAGGGRLYEAYPAAALAVWRLPSRGYKDAKNAEARTGLVAQLRQRTRGWLRLDPAVDKACCASDHELDALIAALIARAAALGLCTPPPPALAEVAAREGWIFLPSADALERIAAG